MLFVRMDDVWSWLSLVKWRGFTCRLWLWLYIILDPQAVFVKDLDSEDHCVWIFDWDIHLCATRHGNTLILVLICICDKVSKCNVNSRKVTVVQSKWVLSQGCPQLPVIKAANGGVFTANLGTVSRHFWRIANIEQTVFRQSSECSTERTAWAICYKRWIVSPNGLLARDNDTVTVRYNLWVMLPAVPYYTWKSGGTDGRPSWILFILPGVSTPTAHGLQ